jgi:nucleoside phosphorylase
MSELPKYTVGWICALPDEMVAARAMLDAEHGKPDKVGATADDNNYFLGSMSGHNVVLACLPLGSPGSASAATVAMHMQHTFTGMRVGLLVGVGSGAPSAEDDIRLGDVVVSTPTDGTGGVIQFERVAAMAAPSAGGCSGRPGGEGSEVRFERARSLNKPPTMLRTALSSLQTEHALNGSRARDLLAQAAAKYPRLQQRLTPLGGSGRSDGSGDAADSLFQAHYVHARDSSGGTCDRCDRGVLVQRRARRHDESPVVHYGIIASGDLEMACGVSRDAAKRALGGVLCFEREAAGLMDNFPCLVIRGVSDYADSHKNTRWQAYAAATAAAFAKELLENVPPRLVESEPTIREVMGLGRIRLRLPELTQGVVC